MRYTSAFAIYQDVCCRTTFAPEELADDFLFLVLTKTVETNDAQGGCVTHHVSIDYLAALLALELLCIIFAVDAVLIELEVVTFGIGTESYRFGMRQFFFHLHPVIFFQLDLDEDDSFLFVEVDGLLGEFPSDKQLDGKEWMTFIIQEGDVRSMSVDEEIGG